MSANLGFVDFTMTVSNGTKTFISQRHRIGSTKKWVKRMDNPNITVPQRTGHRIG